MSHITREHTDAHGFLTKMHRGNSLDVFIEGDMFFGAEYVKYRHDLLAKYLNNNDTPLELDPKIIREYPLILPSMDALRTSLGILLSRCETCRWKHNG
jgi:hypothetical protein